MIQTAIFASALLIGSAGGDLHDPALLSSITESLVSDVRDSFFIPEDSKNWLGEDEKSAQEILTMSLITDRRLMAQDTDFTTDVYFVAQGPDNNTTCVNFENYDNINKGDLIDTSSRIDKIMDKLLGSSKWSGSSYEYNDGAYGRVSGYSESSTAVAFISMFRPAEAGSAHEHIATVNRLVTMLMESGMDQEEAKNLVAGQAAHAGPRPTRQSRKTSSPCLLYKA